MTNIVINTQRSLIERSAIKLQDLTKMIQISPTSVNNIIINIIIYKWLIIIKHSKFKLSHSCTEK